MDKIFTEIMKNDIDLGKPNLKEANDLPVLNVELLLLLVFFYYNIVKSGRGMTIFSRRLEQIVLKIPIYC